MAILAYFSLQFHSLYSICVMRKLTFYILSAIILPLSVSAQIKPAEGAMLHYRIVPFTAPAMTGSEKAYKYELAIGHYNDVDSFTKNICAATENADNHALMEAPAWGTEYTWRVVNHNGNKRNSAKSELHHFSTDMLPNVDTTITRCRVLKQAATYADAYFFSDGARTLYDMKGNAVWHVPNKADFLNERLEMRDLKTTPQGTITFLLVDKAYEINYDGDILWHGPNKGEVSGDTQEYYHHELTRLKNGHYMTLGNEMVPCKLPTDQNSTFEIGVPPTLGAANQVKAVPFGTVIEYDEHDKVVWSWKSSRYFKSSDLVNYRKRYGRPDYSAHENSFYLDEQNGLLYVGFRNISRVVKIKYPEGNVLGYIGNTYTPTDADPDPLKGFFCRQHSARRSQKGYVYLFNNNTCDTGAICKIVMLKEGATPNAATKKKWEYECTVEGLAKQPVSKFQFPTGGNAIEMPDGSLFVSMSSTYTKTFIVGLDKKIRWSVVHEKWNAPEKKWDMIYQYRASIINNRKELENLIWQQPVNGQ